ncbi:MAG: pilus assembly protein PilC [Candidatus Fischerbacteria bacterium RBG_13_37_8]|uniref:Pilus assembly protein PilC n=1 Tax=Candidatus Fischerbacteria bacterium RBG_13_37_8 TaxID=1817863 RepID=A0A1F5V6G5_9BACT|nr:MAG: pilus assembly protein PilC [Candidatus Fischerbacteria bacterium RBG_13_37_8]
MPTYEWKGKRGDSAQTGTIVAESKEAARLKLRRQQIVVTQIKEKGKEIALPWLKAKVSAKDLAIFTRQFSVMIDAGLPLVQCLEILSTQSENKVLQRVLAAVRSDVEAGSSLADAMRKHPSVFDDLFCNMVSAGEAGGILDTILRRLSTHIEKIVKLKRAVRSALTYPAAVIIIAAIVVYIILTRVIPTFETLFLSLGADLPFLTQLTITLSKFVGRFGVFIIIGIGLFVWSIYQYHKTYRGRRVLDQLILKTPILGIVMQKIAIARFCRTLATLISSGVAILDALEITAKTSGNAIVEDAIMATRKSIEGGKSIADPMRDSPVFPPMVVHMVAVGEQTGALDAMLSKIADFYEDEVDVAVQNMLTLIEPIMILFLGTVIGGIVISMYLPLFSLIRVIG